MGKSQPTMKVLLIVALVIAAAVATPEAEADADAAAYYSSYFNRGYGYGGYGRRFYGFDGVDTTDVTSTRGLLMLSPRPKLKLKLTQMPLTTIVKTTDILNDFTKDLLDLLLGIMDSESKTKLTNTPLTETSTEATETPTETT